MVSWFFYYFVCQKSQRFTSWSDFCFIAKNDCLPFPIPFILSPWPLESFNPSLIIRYVISRFAASRAQRSALTISSKAGLACQ